MKQSHKLYKTGLTLMSALMFAPLLLSDVSTSASQTTTNNTSSSVEQSGTSDSTPSVHDSNGSNDGTTNIFNVSSSSSSDVGFEDALHAQTWTPLYIIKHYYDNLSPANKAAKWWMAEHESSFRYFISNGNVYGRFQLKRGYLHGNYSRLNQEKTADRYVNNRYGSWVNAKKSWLYHKNHDSNHQGWYAMEE